MNKKLSIALLICLSYTNLAAQNEWELLAPSPTSNQMVSLDFIDEYTGLSVGEYGTILKSTDSGESWRIIEIEWLEDLTDIDFVTQNIAYAVGIYGHIIKSADGGETWEKQAITYTNNLHRVRFKDENTGWIIGEKGLVLHTSDGGEHWDHVVQGFTVSDLNGMALMGDSGLCVVGDASNILIFSFQSNEWQIIQVDYAALPTQYGDEEWDFNDVYFHDNNHGWIGGYLKSNNYHGILLETTVGGLTWQVRNESLYYYNDNFHNQCNVNCLFFTGIQQVYFDSTGRNGVILSCHNNFLYQTRDFGESWYYENPDNEYHNNYSNSGRFSVLNDNRVINTGFMGEFRYSNDGGKRWTALKEPYTVDCFLVGQNGEIIRYLYKIDDGTQQLNTRSTDYGTSWQQFTPVYYNANNDTVSFQTGHYDHSYQFGHLEQNSTILNMIQINWETGVRSVYESDDFGRTGKERLDSLTIQKGIFLSADTVVYGKIRRIYMPDQSLSLSFHWEYSFDGGRTTKTNIYNDLINIIDPITFKNFSSHIDVHFIDSRIGFCVCHDGNILKTKDTGQTWENIYSGVVEDLHSIMFIDKQTGFITGDFGRILKTSDGGQNWRKTNSGTQEIIYCIDFKNSSEGYIGTESGILYSNDGGENWRKIPLRYSHHPVYNIKFDQNGNGFAYSYGYLEDHTSSLIASTFFARLINNDVHISNNNLPESKLLLNLNLHPNYPNPFNNSTQIRYHLPVQGQTTLKIYNISGQLIRTLIDEHQKTGTHTIQWDGASEQGAVVASGIYFYQLQCEGKVKTKKLMMLK